MADENLFETFDKNLYRQGAPLYKGDGTPITDISNIQPSNIGDGFSAGSTEMVTHNLQSGKFVTGVSGWSIDADGNAEFNNGTFRGTFIIGGALITVGDINDLQPAIDAVSLLGGGTVSLVPDDYSASSNYTIPSGVTVDGNGSTIDFGGGAYQFLIQGTNAYSTGTLSINYNSQAVTGVGTTWTAAMIGRSILIGEQWYEIENVISTTSLTITNAFNGINLSGDTYVIATTVDDVSIRNITLQNSSTSLVKFRYVNGISFDNVFCRLGDTGIEGNDSANLSYLNSGVEYCSFGITLNNVPFLVLNNFNVFSCTSGGIILTRISNSTVSVTSIQDISGVGIKFTNCSNFTFSVWSIIECSSHGVEFVSGNTDFDIGSGYVNTVGGDAIKLTATSDRITISDNSLLSYTGYGVNIAAASCDNNIIASISFSGGGSGNINDSGTGTIIIADDTAYNATTWNGNMGVATKNAIRDKFESLSSTPFFQQLLPTIFTTQSPGSGTFSVATGSNTDGSVLYVYEQTGSTILKRYARDTNTGMYYVTHIVNATIQLDGSNPQGGVIIQIGIYIYLFGSGGTNIKASRFLAADLTGESIMTVPTVGSTGCPIAWTDGTDAYVIGQGSTTTSRRWTVSGTTFTAASTATCIDNLQPGTTGNSGASMFDGTNIYLLTAANSSNYKITKLSNAAATAVVTTTILTNNGATSFYSNASGGKFIIPIDSTKIYVGQFEVIFNATAQYTVHGQIIPLTKP